MWQPDALLSFLHHCMIRLKISSVIINIHLSVVEDSLYVRQTMRWYLKFLMWQPDALLSFLQHCMIRLKISSVIINIHLSVVEDSLYVRQTMRWYLACYSILNNMVESVLLFWRNWDKGHIYMIIYWHFESVHQRVGSYTLLFKFFRGAKRNFSSHFNLLSFLCVIW
jgi:hypothetical protein